MRNISGLRPYIKLSKSAKLHGGPENFICKICSSEYAMGYSSGYTSGLINGCLGTVLLGGAALLGIGLHKRYKGKKEREE